VRDHPSAGPNRFTQIIGREDVDVCFWPCFPGLVLVRA
jgi:hypothetical protein